MFRRSLRLYYMYGSISCCSFDLCGRETDSPVGPVENQFTHGTVEGYFPTASFRTLSCSRPIICFKKGVASLCGVAVGHSLECPHGAGRT